MLCIALSALAALAPQDDHGYAAQALTLEDGSRFAYRLLPPAEPVAERSYPLLVFLHGAGERGSDNLAQLAHLPEHLATPEYRALFDGFVLAPQCRANQRWVETDWSAETSTPMTEELRLDGSYEHRAQGLLTYGGVHPSAAGSALLADWLADGVRRALER